MPRTCPGSRWGLGHFEEKGILQDSSKSVTHKSNLKYGVNDRKENRKGVLLQMGTV